MDIIAQAKQFAEESCKNPDSKYGPEPFDGHLVPMVKYAEKLADKLGGDKEIILVAAWLHDVGCWIVGREDHHITGANIAEKKLKELRYPQDKIEKVKTCILNHRGSQKNVYNNIEEKIVAEADAISNFDDMAGLFQTILVHEKLNRKEANRSVREKLERKWNQLQFDESRELVRPRYEAFMLLLK